MTITPLPDDGKKKITPDDGKKVTPDDGKKVTPDDGKKVTPGTTSLDLPATLVVSLPAEATLTVDGAATTSTSSRRVLVSPPLKDGKEFSYVLQARVVRAGKPQVQTKKVTVRAGQDSPVSFDFAETAAVASK